MSCEISRPLMLIYYQKCFETSIEQHKHYQILQASLSFGLRVQCFMMYGKQDVLKSMKQAPFQTNWSCRHRQFIVNQLIQLVIYLQEFIYLKLDQRINFHNFSFYILNNFYHQKPIVLFIYQSFDFTINYSFSRFVQYRYIPNNLFIINSFISFYIIQKIQQQLMTSNNSSLKGLQQLRSSLIQKQDFLNSVEQVSFLQSKLINQKQNRRWLIDFYIWIIQNDQFKGPILSSILRKQLKDTYSILGFCHQNIDIFKEQRFLTISHRQAYSEAILLSLFLAKEQQSTKVDFVVSEKSLKGIGHLIAEQNEADRLGFTKNAAFKEGITIHSISDWEPQTQINSESIIIIDLFDLNPVDYRPFLIKNYSQLINSKKVLIYHSHVQDDEVLAQIISAKGQIGEWLQLQLWPEQPLECIVEKDQQSMLNRLYAFLKEDSERSEKQDTVIFIPADVHLKRFSGKIAEQLSKNHIKQRVNLISKAHQPQPNTKNNIFLVTGTAQLSEWDYDYKNIFYVLDYETMTDFCFDYQLGAYVSIKGQCSALQKARRMAVVSSNRVGRYVCLSSSLGANVHYADYASELSTYILKMIALGISQCLQTENKRVFDCLKLMRQFGILSNSQIGLSVSDTRLLQAVKQDISPIEAKLVLDILDDKSLERQQKLRHSNLMIMFLSILRSRQNLHTYKVGAEMISSNKHWDSLWKTSGYLQSCLTILAKCDSIDIKNTVQPDKISEAQVFKRISSKISEDQEKNFFGSLFQLCEQVPQNNNYVWEIPGFLKHHLVNEQIYYEIRQRIDHFREFFQLTPVEMIVQIQDLKRLFKSIITKLPKTLAVYTGFKRIGYRLQIKDFKMRLNQENLFAKSRVHPQFLFVFGLIKKHSIFEVLYANAINSETLLQIDCPVPLKTDVNQGETEISFHGIPNSIFQQLWKNNEQFILKFQTESKCSIEANQQMAMILIHCAKENAEQIKNKFQALLTKIKDELSLFTKMEPYLGKTSLLLGSGGEVVQIVKYSPIFKCQIHNIHLNVTKQDLQELFQEFFILKSIIINEQKVGELCKAAVIDFYSPKDYQKLYEYFNGCLYYDLHLEVRPIKEEDVSKIKPKQYIDFNWFVWQSHGKALVRFQSTETINKVVLAFKKNPKLDDSEVVVSCEQNNMYLQNLKSHTDQMYIYDALKGYGEILEVQLMKSPLREETNPDHYLENLIRKAIRPQMINNVHFQLEGVVKKANGQRSCRVNIDNIPTLRAVVAEYHQKVGVLGEGRLYALPFFEQPVLVPAGLTTLYLQILEQIIKGLPPTPHTITRRYAKQDHKEYIILVGNSEINVRNIYQQFLKALHPQAIKLTKGQRSLLFNDIALSNIIYIEEKYRCKIVVDIFLKDVKFICTKAVGKIINDEIKERLCTSFFYVLRLNSKVYKHFQNNQNQLQQIYEKYKLALMQLQKDSYSILVRGPVQNVQKSVSYLMHFAETLVKSEEHRINPAVCGICCDPFKKPYRLQRCCHLFCSDCLKGYFGSVLQDASMFPIKCPHCLQLLTLKDLQLTLNKQQWQKMKTISVNRFVGLNGQKMRFCYTIGCKQINFLNGPIWECETCKISYCNLCKETTHHGIRCEDVHIVRQSDQYFKKYLLQCGGRNCPNPACKMPVVKIEGCNKVLCTRCNKSMCFKCPPEQMIPYDTPNECYDHLNQVHGGYY